MLSSLQVQEDYSVSINRLSNTGLMYGGSHKCKSNFYFIYLFVIIIICL